MTLTHLHAHTYTLVLSIDALEQVMELFQETNKLGSRREVEALLPNGVSPEGYPTPGTEAPLFGDFDECRAAVNACKVHVFGWMQTSACLKTF